MTSVQVDTAALRAAAKQLRQAAEQMAQAHRQASSELDVDVPHLHGASAAAARGMLQEALAACFRLGDSASRLAAGLTSASDDADLLEAILVECLTPGSGSRSDAGP